MKNALFGKLARLRREPPGTAGLQPGSTALDSAPARAGEPDTHLPHPSELPAWLTARFEAHAVAKDTPSSPTSSPGPPSGLVEYSNARGTFAARLRAYSTDHAHGDWNLGEVLAAQPAEFAWLARDSELEALLPERAVYLDIETTGLSGGAGTIPFLVALGAFEDGVFRLWQAFMREPAEEAAALVEVAKRVRAASGVVSFFGKSFDRHRLEDKMRLHRIEPPFAGKPHLDLYHPLRRLYRSAYVDARLATFERELCGVARGHDLPGSLAPAAWFDYLAARPHRLEAVFRHNELDVLSLVTLSAHLARTRHEVRSDGRGLSGAARARARSLAELHSARREHAAALPWLEHALTRSGGDEGELWLRHAECLRKLGQRVRAIDELLQLARGRDDAIGARAWGETYRLARRLRLEALATEARARGPALIERTLTGRARAKALAAFRESPR